MQNPRPAKDIFITAVENYKSDQWPIFLDGACGDDGELRARVEELLDAHRQNDSFLDQPAATVDNAIEESSGSVIGPFKLLQKIGEGGFGVVYMAEQTKPVRRKVALKIIKPGMDSKEVIARFEAERQALAMMDHPNIAKVVDAGATDSGRPYFAMELVKGVTITQYADSNHLSTKDRLTLFASICRAVHHAHQKGVIHRDLKPSNVMVTLHDGKPVAKVIDFGVSKAVSQPLTEQTLFTRYGQVIGTPQYMSPEQAEMSGLDVDTRSDIYSLGVILYELLTGRTPFSSEQIRAAGFDEMRRMIKEQEPVRPSNALQTLDADTATSVASNRSCKPEALHKLVRGELDWIVMRSLEKDRNRRYDSASSLAEDIDRHLKDEPVEASPPSLAYRAWKTYRRNRWTCMAGAAVAASLFIGLGLAVYGMVDSRRSAKLAMEASEEVKAQKVIADDFAAKAKSEAQSSRQTLDLLLGLLTKADVNPDTGEEYTVREALSGLAVRTSPNVDFGAEQDDDAPRPTIKQKLPPKVAAELHLALGKAYLSSENFGTASEHFEAAATANRKLFGDRSLKLASSLRYLGLASGSVEKLKEAIQIDRDLNATEDLSVSLTYLGRLYAGQGSVEDAIECLLEAAKVFRPRADIMLDEIPHMHLARIYRSRGEQTLEGKYLRLATQSANDSLGGEYKQWLSRGKSLRDQRRFDESELALLVADSLSSGGESDEPALYLGLNYRDRSEYELAEKFLKKSIEQARSRKDTSRADSIASLLGQVLADAGKFSEAIEYFKTDLERGHTNSQDALATLLVLGLESSEISEWLREYRAGLEKTVGSESGPGRAQAAGLLARFELVDGNMERCYELLNIARLKKLGSEVQEELLLSRGQLDEAASFFMNMTKLSHRNSPGTGALWKQTVYARSLYHLHNFERGEAELRDVVEQSRELKPRNDFLHYWVTYELGILLYWRGQEVEARKLFEEVAAKLEEYREGNDLLWRDSFFDRITQWECEILAGKVKDPDAMITKLKAHLGRARDENARSAAYSLLGHMYDSIGDRQKALTAYEQQSLLQPLDFSVLPCHQTDERLVEMYQQTEQLERGKDHFLALIKRRDEGLPKIHPRRAFARVLLAKVLLQMEGQSAEALTALEEAQQIMLNHKTAPAHVTDEIAALLVAASKQG